ncbi:MAG: tripartite tricarboxylate transporter TctB family protein [Rhodobacteraceae bacterium]|nr:tripartite tricarboxylate transporter TctB family protein [Paracoccaceae bacterium]
MPAKTADLVFFTLLALLGLGVIAVNRDLPVGFGGDIGPAAVPVALGILLTLLSLAGLVRNLRRPARPAITLPGAGKIAVTLMSMAAFFALWQAVGHFFVLGFVLLTGLFLLYGRDEPLSPRYALVSAAGAAAFMLLAWAFFTHLLYVRF